MTSTEQPIQEKTQSTSKQEVTTQETSTTEVQPKTNNHKLKNSLNMKLKKHIHKATRKKHLQKKLKPTQPTTENKQSEKVIRHNKLTKSKF